MPVQAESEGLVIQPLSVVTSVLRVLTTYIMVIEDQHLGHKKACLVEVSGCTIGACT